MLQKTFFRKILLEKRGALSPEQRHAEDSQIAALLCACPQFEDAEYVLTYLSFGSEVDTRAIAECARGLGKIVAAPRCIEGTRDMLWFKLGGDGCLERSTFGMEEPRADACQQITAAEYGCKSASAIAIVPGLAFDRQGFRIGYGGGFYDKFLSEFSGTSIGLCRTGFLYDDLHAEKAIDRHDLPVDIVVTPEALVYAKLTA